MSATSLTWRGRSIPGPGGLPTAAVSLTGPSLTQARTQTRSVVDAGADILESHVDLLEEVGGLAAPDPLGAATAVAQVLGYLRGLGRAIAADDVNAIIGAPVLLTCRTAVEGGRTQLDDASYGALLRSVFDRLAGWAPEHRPATIDVEVQRDCLPQVCEQARGLGIDVVVSFHDFEVTPADEVLEEILAHMARKDADLAEIAVWPTSAHDVIRLLGVCARATASAREHSGLGVPVAVMPMGALGAVGRVAPTFGPALTFAVVPDEQGQVQASTPGQLPIQDVHHYLELLRV